MIRFVDTRFEAQQTADKVRSLIGGVRDISVHPMPLRSIFVTIARNSSRAGMGER